MNMREKKRLKGMNLRGRTRRLLAVFLCVCMMLTMMTITAKAETASVTTIGNSLFSNCTSLAYISVAESNPSYISENGILFEKGKTTLIAYPANKEGTSYEIPYSVTVIKNGAFACTHLTNIVLPDGVSAIGDYTFEKSSITSITVLERVGSVDVTIAAPKAGEALALAATVSTTGVAESADYQAVSDLTAGSWTFTISPKEIKAADLEFADTTITKKRRRLLMI